MTGLVLLGDPPTDEHLRFRLRLSKLNKKNAPTNGRAKPEINELLFWDRRGLGVVSLLTSDEFAAKFTGENASLGPDALKLTAAELRHRLSGSRRAIKVALLDQGAVAGIGNLYASEILNVAGIHPAARCHRLRSEQWNRLYAAMHLVLEEAIRHEGSTLSDGTYRNALNESGGYQNYHRVYDRAGQTVPYLPPRHHPPHRPSPAIDVFLPQLPAAIERFANTAPFRSNDLKWLRIFLVRLHYLPSWRVLL